MRRVILSISLILGGGMVPAAQAQNLDWLTDADAARDRAKQENKFVLLDFTGSDWCGWCIKLKQEVFDKAEFAEFARARLVLVDVDFPRHKTLVQLQHQANARLAKAYHVTGYPTLIVLNPDGQQVGRMSYVAGGPANFIRELERVARMRTSPVLPLPTNNHDPGPERGPQTARSHKPYTWTAPPAPAPVAYGPIALKAISGTKERRVVLINNATMMTGETANVRARDQEVVVCCKEIREDSVVITCDGKQMELKLGTVKETAGRGPSAN